jgi:hypothetical protein
MSRILPRNSEEAFMRRLENTVALAVSLAAIACADPTGPFVPVISNETDNFSISAPGLENVTTTQIFAWDNTGTAATVVQSSNFTRGSGTLTILDAAGTEVHVRDLSTAGTFQTTTGVSGEWTIHMLIRNVHGSLSFTVQKQ